jgi:hypothetical protein
MPNGPFGPIRQIGYVVDDVDELAALVKPPVLP